MEPPNPKELTEIRRRPEPGHGTQALGTFHIQQVYRYNGEQLAYLDVVPLRPKLRIELLEQGIRRDNALLKNEDGFEHACEATPTL